MRVNFHTHSNKSDGKLSPSELINKLAKCNIEVLALTDHDSVKGIEEAKAKADLHGIKFITGIELSTKIHGLELDFLDENRHTIHLLGLHFDYEMLNKILIDKEELKKLKIKNLVTQLIEVGYNIEPLDYGSKKTLVAEALIKKGYAINIQNAFNNIINNFYPRSVDLVTVDEAVRMIHKANGKVIWAHPYEIIYDVYKHGITESQIDKICAKLKLHHVDGIEVYYAKYNKSQIEFLESLKRKYSFITSAGTDFHNKTDYEQAFIDIDIELIKEVLSCEYL